MKKIYSIIFLVVLIPSLCHGEEHPTTSSNVSGVKSLSPDLRELLSREMRQLQEGMITIHPLYISGEWVKIIPIARAMKNSYVLKQSLTKQQMHELHKKLPHEFIGIDQQFHYLAGMLEHAAEMKKPELIGFYFSKMSETCVRCHSKFATHRFPALAPETHTQEH